ncbi:MAG: zinc transporter ZntB [Phycisphaerales bacterium]|nr:zinc transporter ZntB [Phycisphaerales bacterium]
MAEPSFFHRGFVLDGRGGAHPIDAPGTADWAPAQGVLWVVLDRHSPETRPWLRKVADLRPLIVDSILAHEPRPRCLAQADGLLVTLRGVNLNQHDRPEDMVALRGWFDPHRAILLRGRKVFAVDDVAATFDQHAGPTRSAELLVRLVDALSDHIAQTADDLGLQADQIEADTHAPHEPANLRERIGDLRTRCMNMRRHIVPQRDMAGRMASEPSELLTPDDRARLREDAEQLARVVDDLDLIRERLLIAQEQADARVAERLARNTYLLSIVAAIFLPVGFLTALAGVSVAGIPGQQDPLAFWVLCGILALVLVLEVVLLRRMKWM